MSVHTGVPNCDVERSTGRMTYVCNKGKEKKRRANTPVKFGPVVDKAKKLLRSTVKHVSIIASSAIMEQINSKVSTAICYSMY